MKKVLLALLVLTMTFSFSACGGKSNTQELNEGSYHTNTVEEEPPVTPEPVVEEDPSPQINETFMFEGLELTVGEIAGWSTVQNQFSELNGMDVFKVQVRVKNISDSNNSLNIFSYNLYGSQGTRLDSIGAYFDDAHSAMQDLRPAAEEVVYVYFLYDGDGTYYISFDDYINQTEIAIPVTKA